MDNTFTLFIRRGETLDQVEDRFFSEHPELLTNHDLTLLIIDLVNDWIED